jgi:WD40 repeat protein
MIQESEKANEAQIRTAAGKGEHKSSKAAKQIKKREQDWQVFQANRKETSKILNHKITKRSIGCFLFEPTAILVTPDKKYLVFGSEKDIALWSLEEGDFYLRFEEAHFDKVTTLAITTDGKYILSGSEDKTVGIWSLLERKNIQYLQGHVEKITTVAASSDNRFFVSGSIDSMIVIWKNAGSVISSDLKLHHNINRAQKDKMPITVAVTLDDKHVVSGSGQTIGIWDISNGTLHSHIDAHHDNITQILFTPNNKYLVSCSEDTTIAFWRVSDWELEHRYSDEHGDSI